MPIAILGKRFTNIYGDNLVLHYDILNSSSYSGTGNTWNDLSPEQNDGTIFNGNFDGTHLNFNGSNTDVIIPNDPSLQITGDLTIEFWFSPAVITGNNTVVSKSFTAEFDVTPGQYVVFYNGPTLSGNFRIFSEQTLVVNDVYHVVVTRQGSNNEVSCYINNTFVASEQLDDTPPTSTNDLVIGNRPVQNITPFEGWIDVIRIYDSVLSPTLIQQNFQADKNRFGV